MSSAETARSGPIPPFFSVGRCGKVRGVVIQLYLHFTLPLSNVGHCFAAVNRSARAQSCPVLFLEEGAELGSAKPDSCALTCVFSRQIHDENSMVAGSASSVAIR